MEAIIALSTSGFIEKYGAYAGLAAIPGLAVLSLLYFAQAREVRRLRDWAGRAPERDVERSTSGVHVAPTGARDPVSVVRRSPPPGATRPGGRPASPGAAAAAPASPAAAPPKPAGGAAMPAAATAAAAGAAAAVGAGAAQRNDKPPDAQPAARPGEDNPAAKPADAPAPSPAAKPADAPAPSPAAKPADAPAPSPAAKPADAPAPSPAAAPQQNGPGDPSHVESPAQRPAAAPAQRSAAPAAATAAGARASAGPAAPPRPVPRARPSEPHPVAQPVPPSTPGAAARAVPLRADQPRAGAPGRGGRDPVPPRRDDTGGRPRRAAYIAVAAVLLIVLVVVIVAATSGGGSQTKAPNTIAPNQQPAQGATPKRHKAAPVQRGDVKVAALNGTTQAGLAAQVENQITASGFAKGQVTNAADQQAQKTIVYYASGQKKAAQEVASIIKAGAVQPIDPDTRAIAGNAAKVVVLVGADKT